jgi:hypothetical protein
MTTSITLRGVLAASAIAEAATGIVLAVDPALVTSLLFGVDAARHWTPLGRVAGVALLALGLACWPATEVAGERTPAARAMLVYNPLIASYLVYLATVGVAGILLWPAVAWHGIVTLLLLVGWQNESGARAKSTRSAVAHDARA